MESESSKKARAVFMAFGTKGDVLPISAIAACFAIDQLQYQVFLITHSSHQNLIPHLAAKSVSFLPVSSPPVVSAYQDHSTSESVEISFSMQKKIITKEHRNECLDVMGRIFGDGPSMEDDFIVINFFALEGWSLAELFRVRCVVAAPYVVPYSAPSSFERQFKKDIPLLFNYLQLVPPHKVCWNDVIHWMWPLFTEDWGSWRSELNLSPCPFMDPVTGLPTSHDWVQSPMLLYGFSKEVVECPGCLFYQFFTICGIICYVLLTEGNNRDLSIQFSERYLHPKDELCSTHMDLQCFLMTSTSDVPIFIGFSSVGSMGFLRNSRAFLLVLQAVIQITNYRFILFTAGYEPLDSAIQMLAEALSCFDRKICSEDGVLFWDRLFCFSGTIPYNWLFQRCAVVVHHGGSGSTAAALHTGLPQVICPFLLDQFYWAERMFWLGVAPEPLDKYLLFPDKDDDTDIWKAANVLTNALNSALSPEIKACASEISERIVSEDGVGEAVNAIKEEMKCQS
ncbi:hypothetical protein IFM89_039346 [Coptis chinensis]|uniref:Erythromycin biosynthesis protein CIII-like C-terminal domain-containing protein n=1 Tax=Coptis chinensis TaxID=261450 RepID=A0A835HT75_9MAGN|nr:hypothetical protein IFM89_039346 [Coptis chinensis]